MEDKATPKEFAARQKSLRFAVRVVNLCKYLREEKKEFSVPSDLSIHTYGDYTISENKEAMISEVDSLL